MTAAFADFHFLRPLWLALGVPWAYLLYRLWRHDATRAFWDRVCDPVLLPFVVENRGGRVRRRRLLPFALGGLLTISALAGPTYQRLPQPVFRDQAGLVILLDLSTSMNATDTPPNRLERARVKIESCEAMVLTSSVSGATMKGCAAKATSAVWPPRRSARRSLILKRARSSRFGGVSVAFIEVDKSSRITSPA